MHSWAANCCLASVGNVTQDWLQLGPNIKLLEWAPQNDILGHSAVKAFVTHAGSNGLYEAAYHGKPVVPIMNEQPGNAAKVSLLVYSVTLQQQSDFWIWHLA